VGGVAVMNFFKRLNRKKNAIASKIVGFDINAYKAIKSSGLFDEEYYPGFPHVIFAVFLNFSGLNFKK
jgi:ABC-type thiamine transport system substrate-binding protein